MEQVQQTGKWDKFKAFLDKTHLQYLAFAFLLYGFKAMLYFIIAYIPSTRMAFFYMGDPAVPFLKYFYVFYLGYYIVPELFLWMLSFYDKRKIFDLVLGAAMVNIVCCTCFLIYQVKMQRVDALEIKMGLHEGWDMVTGVSSFFDRLIIFQYNADGTATNCYPSLHATFGAMLFLLGMPLSKHEVTKEHHFPIWARVFCIIFGLGIVMSTFFIKQHYYIDAIVGMALMCAMYYVARFVIDWFLEIRALPKEEKDKKRSGYFFLGGMLFNAMCVALFATMFLFGALMSAGCVTDAIRGATPTPEIISLGHKYMLGFGLSFFLTGFVFAYQIYMRVKKVELDPKTSNVLLLVLGGLSVNPFYITSGILSLNKKEVEA